MRIDRDAGRSRAELARGRRDGRRGRRGSIPPRPSTVEPGAPRRETTPSPTAAPRRAAGAAAAAATPKGSERRVLFSDEIPVSKDAATSNLLAQVLSPGKAYRRIFGRGGARDAANDAPSPTATGTRGRARGSPSRRVRRGDRRGRRPRGACSTTGSRRSRWTAHRALRPKEANAFFSPGGKRYGSAAEVVQHIEKQRTGGVDVDDIDGVEEASEEHLTRLKRAADETENAEAEEKETRRMKKKDGDDEDDEGSDDDDEEEEEEKPSLPRSCAAPRRRGRRRGAAGDEFITIRKDSPPRSAPRRPSRQVHQDERRDRVRD